MEMYKLRVVFAMNNFSYALLTEGSSHHTRVVLLYYLAICFPLHTNYISGEKKPWLRHDQ